MEPKKIFPNSYLDYSNQQENSLDSIQSNISRYTNNNKRRHNKTVNSNAGTISAKWIYSNKPVAYNEISSFLKEDEDHVPMQVFSDAIRKMASEIEKTETRLKRSTQLLLSQKRIENQLKESKGILSYGIDEMIEINDEDREAILKQTKYLDNMKVELKNIKKAVKLLKPGETLNLASKEEKKQARIEQKRRKAIMKKSKLLCKKLEERNQVMDEISMIDVNDPTFTELMEDLKNSDDPSSQRLYMLLKATSNSITKERERSKEVELDATQTRHRNLETIKELQKAIEVVREDLESLNREELGFASVSEDGAAEEHQLIDLDQARENLEDLYTDESVRKSNSYFDAMKQSDWKKSSKRNRIQRGD